MKSRIFGHRDRTLAVIAIALGVVVDGYLGRAGLAAAWNWYAANHEAVVPIFNWVGGAVAAWVALSQLNIARKRHDAQVKRDDAQTKADRQRHIQESFTTAVEQLGSEKLQVRLGGIYTLERLYKLQHIYNLENPQDDRFVDDYWTIMETLTAFIRESVNKTRTSPSDETPGAEISRAEHPPLPTDIIAALSVVGRRPEWTAETEYRYSLSLNFAGLDFSGICLREFNLHKVNFRGANLTRADLQISDLTAACFDFANLTEGYLGGTDLSSAGLYMADLTNAHLNSANFSNAKLFGANLFHADLFDADLTHANLAQANLNRADLRVANLTGTVLYGANLTDAALNGADLADSKDITVEQLTSAKGDKTTKLPEGMPYPNTWPKD